MTRDHVVADDAAWDAHFESIYEMWDGRKHDTVAMAKVCGISEAVADSLLSSLIDGIYYRREEEASYAGEAS
jgi:hypothetical protein